jgi:hypothetical protein
MLVPSMMTGVAVCATVTGSLQVRPPSDVRLTATANDTGPFDEGTESTEARYAVRVPVTGSAGPNESVGSKALAFWPYWAAPPVQATVFGMLVDQVVPPSWELAVTIASE